MNRHVSLLLLVAGALAAGCTAKSTRKAEAESPPYVFPHKDHVENDVACTNCHAGVQQATKLQADVRHVKLPAQPGDACSGCHDTVPAITIPARKTPFELNFDHAAHLPRVKGDCKRCHKDLPEKGARSYEAPQMGVCTSCHNHQADFAEARCTPCHKDLKSYELKPVSAFSHRGDWLRTHGDLARPSAQACAACHDQTYCANCHSAATAPTRPSIRWPEQVESDFIHRGDYVSRHMIEAGAQPQTCRRCHGSAFCQACHEQQGVAALGLPTDRRVHPDNWVQVPGGGQHAPSARANIVTCAGCHDQGGNSVCVQCHRSAALGGGIGGNPHPPGWGSRHKVEDQHKQKVCIVCHG